MIRLELPIDEALVRTLHVGDEVSIRGRIVTARDAAHKLMVEKAPPELDPLLRGSLIYHCGPVMRRTPAGSGWEVVAAGPTTSIREEPYQGTVFAQYGVRGVIGKGGMGPQTLEACQRLGAVYLHAVGGAAVSLAGSITRVVEVRMLEELGGPEAFWVLDVDGFPAVVTMDSHGQSLHAKVLAESRAREKALLGL
jgi:fumarate hydratase subunit beta